MAWAGTRSRAHAAVVFVAALPNGIDHLGRLQNRVLIGFVFVPARLLELDDNDGAEGVPFAVLVAEDDLLVENDDVAALIVV